MRILTALVAALILLGCGDGSAEFAGTYVTGDAEKARKRATEPPDKPLEGMTTRDLLESGKTYHFDMTTHMVLELRKDGTFTYYGALKMGDDTARVDGRWEADGQAVVLTLEPPRKSKDELIATLRCPVRNGTLEYPMGRDARNPVYYLLTEESLGPAPPNRMRIGKEGDR